MAMAASWLGCTMAAPREIPTLRGSSALSQPLLALAPDENPPAHLVDELLDELRSGDESALQRLFTVLFVELRASAGRLMQGANGAHTLQPTAVVNEAFLRLVSADKRDFEGRQHFVLAASRAMRHILVDHHRSKLARPQREGELDVNFEALAAPFAERALDLLALDEALIELAAKDDADARLVELRFFGGVSIDEAAEILGVSPRTVDRRWATLRSWLHRRLA